MNEDEFNDGDGDFIWENGFYRPNDLFRVKVRGMFPKVSEDVLIPYEWIELANKNWERYMAENPLVDYPEILGVDVAGMGRDSSVICSRKGYFVDKFKVYQSAGKADHMHVAGMLSPKLKNKRTLAFIDTIGEGAGVWSRLLELGFDNAVS